jgi:hypothetical protein
VGRRRPQGRLFPLLHRHAAGAVLGWTLLRTLLGWSRETALFAQWSELRDVGAMLLPTTVFIVAVPFLGLYFPGAC